MFGGNQHRAYPVSKKIVLVFILLPGSAETLLNQGGKTKHLSIVYFLTNISDKNYQNQLISDSVKILHPT